MFSRGAAASQTASDTWGKNTVGTCLGRGANTYQFTGEYYVIRLYDRAPTALSAGFVDRKPAPC